MSQAEAILSYQPMLHSIAMKIVGTMEDAEDIVQDTFEKWFSADNKNVKNPKAYLIKSVSNNCLQFLNSWKNKIAKKTVCSESQTEITDSSHTVAMSFDVEVQLSQAWAIVHKKLEPVERAVYVMREFFEVEYDELQEIFGKKKENCRKLFSRAKAKIQEDSSKIKVDFTIPALPESFKRACNIGHLSEIIAELKHDLTKSIPQKEK